MPTGSESGLNVAVSRSDQKMYRAGVTGSVHASDLVYSRVLYCTSTLYTTVLTSLYRTVQYGLPANSDIPEPVGNKGASKDAAAAISWANGAEEGGRPMMRPPSHSLAKVLGEEYRRSSGAVISSNEWRVIGGQVQNRLLTSAQKCWIHGEVRLV